MAASFDHLVQRGVALFAAPVLLGVDCARPCTSGVGFGSPEEKGVHGRLQKKRGQFFCTSHTLDSIFMAARVGEPSGSPVPFSRSSNPALGRHPRLEARGAVVLTAKKESLMTGTSMGAHAPAISPRPSAPLGASPQTGPRGHASTRTRLVHSVLTLGDGDATVTSSRRQGEPRAVSITVRQGSILLTGHLTAPQAQALADALSKASKAAVAAAKARESQSAWADTAMGDLVQGRAAA